MNFHLDLLRVEFGLGAPSGGAAAACTSALPSLEQIIRTLSRRLEIIIGHMKKRVYALTHAPLFDGQFSDAAV